MRRTLYSALIGFLVAFPALAAAPKPAKVVKEIWEAALIDGIHVGYVHGLFREIIVGDATLVESAVEFELNLARFGQKFRWQFAMANHETAEGQLLALAIRQPLAASQELVRRGRREKRLFRLTTEFPGQPPAEKKLAYDPKALGLYAEERFLAGQRLKPGTRLEYVRFDPTFDAFLTVHVDIKDHEEVVLLNGEKRRLLRVEKTFDPIMDLTMPPEISWIDGDGETWKRETDLPGIGKLTACRTGEKQALPKPNAVAEISAAQMVKLTQAIADHQGAEVLVFRVRLKNVENSANAFPSDRRQSVRKLDDGRLELRVRRSEAPGDGDPDAVPPEEYLKSNHFITSNSRQVIALARKAVGNEPDPWKKALLIEGWVKKNLSNKNFGEAFATAEQVAKSLSGDCTEHSILAAAMCRAVGVPARTTVGLVYSPRHQAMGYHMWFEVWIGGRWHPLDATRGKGGITAAHIKIADAHWNDADSFTPLVPVARLLGKLEIETVSD